MLVIYGEHVGPNVCKSSGSHRRWCACRHDRRFRRRLSSLERFEFKLGVTGVAVLAEFEAAGGGGGGTGVAETIGGIPAKRRMGLIQRESAERRMKVPLDAQ